jgi:hypothetical protein
MAISTVANQSPTEIVREAGLLLSNSLQFLKSGIPDHSAKFKGGGSGRTVTLARPTKVNVSTGTWNVNSVPNASREVGVQLAMSSTPITVPWIFTDDQRYLDFQDMKQQVITPSIKRLAAEIERTVLTNVMPGIPTFAQAATLTDSAVAEIKQYMTDNLADPSDLKALIRSSMTRDLRNDTKGLFNATTVIGKQNVEGVIARWDGFDFMESTLLPVQTTGTRTNTAGGTVSTTMTEGAITVALDIGAGTETVRKGETFSITLCEAVNDQTKASLGTPKRFTVAADATASGGIVTVTLVENIYASGTDARQNVTRLPTSGDVITWVGGVSATIQQGLFYNPLAFATAFADLPVDDEANGAITTVPGTNIRLRFERQKNSASGETVYRWDVLMASALVDPAFAARFFRTATTTP